MIQTNFNFPTRRQILKFASFTWAAHWWPSSCMGHFFHVYRLRSTGQTVGRLDLWGGVSWKAMSKDLGAKSKDLLCWRRRKGALRFLHLFINVFLISKFSLGDVMGGLGRHTPHYPDIVVE